MAKWQFRIEKNEEEYLTMFFSGQIPMGVIKTVASAAAVIVMAAMQQYFH